MQILHFRRLAGQGNAGARIASASRIRQALLAGLLVLALGPLAVFAQAAPAAALAASLAAAPVVPAPVVASTPAVDPALAVASAPAAAPAPAPATPEPALHVVFHKSSVVRGADYTLGDVATVTAADPGEARRLSCLTMGHSPTLGVALPLNARQLGTTLERLGIGNDANIEYPEQMFLQRDVQNLDSQAFRAAVEKAAREQLPLDHDQLLITDVRVPRLPLLPAGDVTYEFTFRFPSKGVGDVSYQAQVLVDGERQASLTSSLHADVLVETVKVQKRVARGETVGLDACQVALSPLSEQRVNALQSTDFEKPLVAKRDLTPGEMLTSTAVAKQVLVTRGQPVHMLLENGGMRISAQGVARANGSRGDTIEVTNTSSGAKVQAVVVDVQTVSVTF